MTTETMAKVQALLESDEFGKELENIETLEGMKTAFEAHGVEITVQEIEEICVGITSANSSDLNEADLDSVTGGFAVTGLALIAAGWAVSYIAGRVVGKLIKKKTGVCR